MTDLVTLLAVLIVLDVFLWAVPEDVPEAKVVMR